MNLSKSLMSIAVASLLIACGGSKKDDNKSKNKETKETNFKGITKLSLVEKYKVNVNRAIEDQDNEGWLDAKDSSIITLDSKNSFIIGGSKYHNALITVNTKQKIAKHNPFASIKDAGHGKKSKVDATSGASENYLRQVKINLAGDTVYVNIPPKKDNSTTYDVNSFGLFKASILSDGTIEYDNSKKIAIKLSLFDFSNDEKSIIALDKENNLISYDKDLNELKSVEIENIKTFKISKDNKTIFAIFTSSDKKSYLSKINLSDLKLNSEKLDINFEADLILNISSEKILLINKHDMKVAIIDTKTNKILKEENYGLEVNSADVSADGKYLVYTGHDEKKLVIVSLLSKYLEVQSSINLEESAKAITFVDKNTLAYTNDRNSIRVVTINDSGTLISQNEKFDSLIKDLNKSINGGVHNAIIKNINLLKEKFGIQIEWTSTFNKSILNIEDGSVNRPDNNSDSASGKLSAKLSFKDKNKIEVMNLIIRKKPLILPNAKYVETGRSDYMAVSDNGSFVVAPIQYELGDTTKTILYGVASFKVNTDSSIEVKTEAKNYGTNEQVTGVGINDDYAIVISKTTEENKYKGRIYSSKITDGVLASNVTSPLLITSGLPQKVEWNSNQTIAGVLIKKEDGKFITEVYKIAASGVITLAHAINMGDKEYKDYGPAAINEDGSKVIQRDGDSVHISSKTNALIKSKKVENIARVWFGANRIFVNTYSGVIYSYDDNLENEKVFSTGTNGRMYGAEARNIDGKNYLFVPVQRSDNNLNGIYKLEILGDGSLEEIAFSNNEEGADRMAVSKDGKTVIFSFTKDKKRQMAALKL